MRGIFDAGRFGNYRSDDNMKTAGDDADAQRAAFRDIDGEGGLELFRAEGARGTVRRGEALPDRTRDARLTVRPRHPPHSTRTGKRRRLAIAGVVLLVAALVGVVLSRGFSWLGGGMSRVHFESTPSGARVTVDGQYRGLTPLAVELVAGPHKTKVEAGGAVRVFDVPVDAGRDAFFYVQLPAPDRSSGPPPEAAAMTAAAREAAPVATAPSVPATAPPAAGWIHVDAPADLQIVLDGRSVGTTGSDRTMLPAGRHTLDFVNDQIGYQGQQDVIVRPGRLTTVTVDVPPGTLSVNAQPWAEITVDGNVVGETPLAGLTLSAGVHEVVFRHPELGEQRVEALVRAGERARLSADLRRR